MNFKLHILKIASFIFISGAFFLFPKLSFSQNNILELLPGADKLGYDKKTGAHRLVGSVSFIYQGNTMYCDSAHYFEKLNQVKAYGNVQINKDDINLYCDSLFYNGNTKKAKLWGNVRARDLEYKLTTDTLEYDAKNKVGIYRHGGKIESMISNEVLTSKRGYFFPESKNFNFSDRVKYKSSELQMETDTLRYHYQKQTTHFLGKTKIIKDSTTMYCNKGWYNVKTEEGTLMDNAKIFRSNQQIYGDTLIYQSQKGISIAKGHVFFNDSLKKSSFQGNYGYYNELEGYSYLTGKAMAQSVKGKDTLYILADTLYNYLDSTQETKRILAYHQVKFINADFQASSDSLAFDKSTDKAELFKNPIVWLHRGELKGDSMTVYLKDSIIDWVHIHQNSTVIMEIDTGVYYNQIGGKEIKAYLKNNEVYRTDVLGNATTIFFPQEELKTDTTYTYNRKGMNRLYASELKIYIDSNEITGVTYYDRPDGVFYPMNQIPEKEKNIQNFKWFPEERPTRYYLNEYLKD